MGVNYAGRTLDELAKDLPSGVQVTMVRKGGQNIVPSNDIRPGARRRPLIVAEQADAIAEAGQRLGKLEPGRIVKDRSALDYIRVFVGKANMVGVPLAQLPMPSGFPTHLLHVRRYDMDLVPTPDLMLEFGDRVGVLMPPDRKEEIRRHFGDTVKATAEFSYVSLGLGMVLGVLLGLIPIPIPGVGTVTLGIAGGPLIVALIFGKLRRTGPLLWVMPLPANIVLRNFGLAMFLASVGINAGQPFVRTVAESGFTMLFIGAAVLLTTVIIVLLVGYYLLKIPYDDLVGVASGATGNPAILVYSTRMAPTERPDIGYAMIFPSMTIVKVIAVQIVGLLAATGRTLIMRPFSFALKPEMVRWKIRIVRHGKPMRIAPAHSFRRDPAGGHGASAPKRAASSAVSTDPFDFVGAERLGRRIYRVRRNLCDDRERRKRHDCNGRRRTGVFCRTALWRRAPADWSRFFSWA